RRHTRSKRDWSSDVCSSDLIAKKWDLNPNMPTVLIFGGSRGALAINQIVEKSLPELETKPYQVIWATGQLYYGDVKKKLAGKEVNSNIKIVPYIDNMPGLLPQMTDRKSTRLNSSHVSISYAVFCLK